MTKFKLLVILSFFLTACASQRIPITPGTIPSQQSSDITEADVRYGQGVLDELRRQYYISQDRTAMLRMRELVDRLAEAANAGNSNWQIYLFDDDQIVNAAATRGNFIFVWTGMLKKVHDDDELAAVVGHEMGHVLARHTYKTPQEEASQMISDIAGVATRGVMRGTSYSGLAGISAALVQALIAAAIVNPESQRLELEADHIGLFLMAKAGYSPRKAVDFWRRMAENPGFGTSNLSFLSSHPSNDERVKQLEELLPLAEKATAGSVNTDNHEISEQGKAATKLPGKWSKHEKQIWSVQDQSTKVFAGPDTRSKVISSLKHGEVLTVEESGRWLRIDNPIKGYIQSRCCAPENPSK